MTEQVANIKQYTLASVLCDAMDAPVLMQEKALLQPWEGRITNAMEAILNPSMPIINRIFKLHPKMKNFVTTSQTV